MVLGDNENEIPRSNCCLPSRLPHEPHFAFTISRGLGYMVHEPIQTIFATTCEKADACWTKLSTYIPAPGSNCTPTACMSKLRSHCFGFKVQIEDLGFGVCSGVGMTIAL